MGEFTDCPIYRCWEGKLHRLNRPIYNGIIKQSDIKEQKEPGTNYPLSELILLIDRDKA